MDKHLVLLFILLLQSPAYGQTVRNGSTFVLTEACELFAETGTSRTANHIYSKLSIAVLPAASVHGNAVRFDKTYVYAAASAERRLSALLDDALDDNRPQKQLLQGFEEFDIDVGAKEKFDFPAAGKTAIHYEMPRLGFELFYLPHKFDDLHNNAECQLLNLATRESVDNQVSITWFYSKELRADRTTCVKGPVCGISKDRMNRIGGEWFHQFDSSGDWIESAGGYAFTVGGPEVANLPVRGFKEVQGVFTYRLTSDARNAKLPREIREALPKR